MRYFKCDTLKQEDREMMMQDSVLTDEEQKRNRQGKRLNYVAIALASIIFLAAFVGSEYMIAKIPDPQNAFHFVLAVVGRIILTLGVLIVSILIGSLAVAPILKKTQEKMIFPKRTVFDKSILFLRDFYGWKEPCIVTKCYDSDDKHFKNRDVCIFFANEELRLTANLLHGFSVKERDLGCYAFQMDEFSLSQIQGANFLMTELKVGDRVFLLGRRAKAFIENHLAFDRKKS